MTHSASSVDFTVVIPARYSSTRLPGKPLAMIAGKPMIQHVYERASASLAKQVIVATDDERIADACADFGAEACLTSVEHASGTDRLHEVAERYGLADDAIVVNVQGDEPLIPPAVINQVATNLSVHTAAAAATLSESISEQKDYRNPNVVKVVTDHQGYALYFSRAAVPYAREGEGTLFDRNAFNRNAPGATASTCVVPQRHIGIYAYRVSLLRQFVQWPMAWLETVECLEQLRILANGEKIHVSEAQVPVPGGVDTPEDLARLQEHLKGS